MSLRPLRLFIAYATEDAAALVALRKHLDPWRRSGLIMTWDRSHILAGTIPQERTDEALCECDLVLCLISADFLAKDDHVEEVQRALRAQKTVVPILVRPAQWQRSPIGHLQPLPQDQAPISTARDQDQAWLSVSQELWPTIAACQATAQAAEIPRPPPQRPMTHRAPRGPRVGERRRPTPAAVPGESLAERLRWLADHAHDNEITAAVAALRSGEYVALEAPAGFGASRCIEEVVKRCQQTADTLVHYVPPRTLATDADAFLEELYRGLKARAVPLPGTHPQRKRDDWLFKELRDAALALHGRDQRLVIAIDNVEKFQEAHQAWLHQLLGALAHLADYWVTDPELRAVTVVVAGGEWLQRHLSGTVKASALSPFNKAQPILLGPARLADAEADAATAAVVAAVGGHPRLLRWAAEREGRTDGDPAAEPGLFQQQQERFRKPPYRQQIARMLGGDWRDPDLALRWSGWLRVGPPRTGWLGPVLERLAQGCVTD